VRWNVAVAGLAGSWGFISILVDAVDLGAGPLVFFRLAIAAATVALLLAALRQSASLRLPRLRLATAATGLGLAAHWLLFFQTIKLASVAVSLVLVYTGPVLLALLAPLYLPELRSRVALAALAPAVAGIALISLVGSEAERPRPLAVVCGLGAAVTYALLVIAFKRLAAELPVPAVNLWTAVVAAVALSPVLLLADDPVPNGIDIVYVFLLGAVFTGMSWLLYLWLLRRVTAQLIGVVSYLEVVSAALLAWVILGQQPGWQVLAGGALIVTAGLVVVLLEPTETAPLEAV
jgi:drug/metabolite transporter (DMT)-like permease